MSFDVHSLEGYSTIASVTGTNPNLTIVVQTGDGAKFGNPQNVTIWPVGVSPTTSNSTIGRITAISTDTLTVTTAQEGSSNITVTAGMQIANTITPKVLTDIEAQALGGTLTATSTNTLSNKSIAAGSNTISGLTNSNLSGSAGITYANLSSTIFSGQKLSQTNAGTAGGTMYYINEGGIKKLWLQTPGLTGGASGFTTWTVTFPTSFFTTVEIVSASLGVSSLGGTGVKFSYAQFPSTTGVTLVYYNAVASTDGINFAVQVTGT